MERFSLPKELNEAGLDVLEYLKLLTLTTNSKQQELMKKAITHELTLLYCFEPSEVDILMSKTDKEKTKYLLKNYSSYFLKKPKDAIDEIGKFVDKYLDREVFKISIDADEKQVYIKKMIGTTLKKFTTELGIYDEVYLKKKNIEKAKEAMKFYLEFISRKKYLEIIESFNAGTIDYGYNFSEIYVSEKGFTNFDIVFSIKIDNLTSDVLESIKYIVSDVNNEYNSTNIFK